MDKQRVKLSKIEEAIGDIERGRIVIIVDDEDRENEGDFVVAAERCNADVINFMAKHGRGIICVALTHHRTRELSLDMMVDSNTSLHETSFTVSESKASSSLEFALCRSVAAFAGGPIRLIEDIPRATAMITFHSIMMVCLSNVREDV